MLLLIVLLAQAAAPVPPVGREKRGEYVPPPSVRCVQDSFGNLTCSDGSRVIKDSFGNVTIIPKQR